MSGRLLALLVQIRQSQVAEDQRQATQEEELEHDVHELLHDPVVDQKRVQRCADCLSNYRVSYPEDVGVEDLLGVRREEVPVALQA